jgi:hypothetical protein
MHALYSSQCKRVVCDGRTSVHAAPDAGLPASFRYLEPVTA